MLKHFPIISFESFDKYSWAIFHVSMVIIYSHYIYNCVCRRVLHRKISENLTMLLCI